MSPAETSTRRSELLAHAAELFAEKGFRSTTVRDIADAADILSGSLYHHFDSKESIVDEILSPFQEELFGKYAELQASDRSPREKLVEAVRLSFAAIHDHHHEVAIFQNDADYLGTFERFGYLAERGAQSRELWISLLREGVAAGELRSDLDVELVYRFIRDTVWVAVRWYRPGGDLSHEVVADQYLTILLDGIASPAA